MNKLQKINYWLAVKITNAVGTMTCAYLFAALAIYGGFSVDWHNAAQIVQWISQTFLQLVLLSVIMVGTNLLSESSEKQAAEDHDTILKQFAITQEALEEIKQMHSEMHVTFQEVKENIYIKTQSGS